MGRPPKPPELRIRRNKPESPAALFVIAGRKRVPPLPKLANRTWQPETLRWWREIWKSPCADQLLDVDKHGLYRLAVLVDIFWLEPSEKLASEIDRAGEHYGLTPSGRLKLRWQTKKAEPTEQRVRSAQTSPEDDPRRLFQALN